MSQSAEPSLSSALLGRMFVHSVFDYMLIGGGVSLLVAAVIVAYPSAQDVGDMYVADATKAFAVALPFFLLFSNNAHFAASTVRLYTKPGTFQALPFLTMCFPLVCLAVLAFFIFWPTAFGPHFVRLYLTWSPYHYAAQAYGLAVMYSYRSGCALNSQDKSLLWWVCMIPFLFNFFTGREVGLSWLTQTNWFEGNPRLLLLLTCLIGIAALVAIVLLFVKVWRDNGSPMPLISALVIVTNGVWFFILSPINAFVYATIFHGLQYLAIVMIFHVKDQLARPDNRRGTAYHVLWFYGACLLLGYGLFYCLPYGFSLANHFVNYKFDLVETMLLAVAAINIHHFIVDGYIWRLGKNDPNRRVVDSVQPAVA